MFTDGQTGWGTQLSVLHKLGWRTLLVDPYGTGESPSPPRLFTMEECADAAVQALDAAGVDRAAILGLSWGGFVGLRVALAAPERVVALVLSNSSARRMSPLERQRDRVLSLLVRIGIPSRPGKSVVAQLLGEYTRRHDPQFAAELADSIDRLDNVGLSRAMRSVLAERTSVVDALARITAPTLVIDGADDPAFTRGHSAELAKRIPGAQLEILPRTGHLAPRESALAVSKLIEQFLTGLNPR
ncbi:alpha/beta fold hydrolase [Nocardia sp. bgisy134]|uniref:alpha/beta fold hydrolase n=1 Tax=unclassified Nocardia TaxID=2637762 RepID=UPI003D757852